MAAISDLVRAAQARPAPGWSPALASPHSGWTVARQMYVEAWWPHFGTLLLARWLVVPPAVIAAAVTRAALTRLPKGQRRCLVCRAAPQQPHGSRPLCARCTPRPTPSQWLVARAAAARLVARRAGLPFDLTGPYLGTVWARQAGCCFYTGAPLVMIPPSRVLGRWDPTLDRLVPVAGYTQGNVVWATAAANLAKLSLPPDGFLRLCQAVVRTRWGPAALAALGSADPGDWDPGGAADGTES